MSPKDQLCLNRRGRACGEIGSLVRGRGAALAPGVPSPYPVNEGLGRGVLQAASNVTCDSLIGHGCLQTA